MTEQNPKPAAMAAPTWKISLSDLDYGVEEEQAVMGVLRSKWLSMGAMTRAFEEEFAAQIGVRHAIAVDNGTNALLLSFLSLGIGPGDEIIQPAVNFVASANTTILAGARPIFCDIGGLDDPTIDPAGLERCLTSRTKAVVVMHYGGAACRMEELVAFCRKHQLALIEDACHGVGGSYQGKKMGAWGDAASFSFFSNKNLAIGEGGMITTDRDDLVEQFRRLRSHGMTTLTWDRHRGHAASYDVVRNGLNCRMDELRAVLGREQLRKLERNNQRRRELARTYHQLFAAQGGAPLRERGWIMPALGVETNEAAHHLQVVVAPDTTARDAAMLHLKALGIQTSIHYPFIPEFTAFKSSFGDDAVDHTPLARSKAFCGRVLTLPLHPLLSTEDVKTVVDALRALPLEY